MAGTNPNLVRIVVRGAGKGDRALRYLRGFAGITVEEAIERLNGNDKSRGGLPGKIVTLFPYYLNGEEVDEDSDRVLKAGDVLSAADP